MEDWEIEAVKSGSLNAARLLAGIRTKLINIVSESILSDFEAILDAHGDLYSMIEKLQKERKHG